ncbi:nitroreductase family protein [Roseateles amylovorans]|uniref:Putative NAD(P)H nitroreductase n=1 Tax=Roseateles amylovorans TaxID=2978473 RepID=A0ABY6B8M3_9BURK|nr:nitroreductase [Roseateles amylovorans]UXH79910.1 nitroreductase [Roseateles amylovorans]
MNQEGLALLMARASVGPKHLGVPGPSDEQLRVMVEAALHAPDHGELVPFRFKVVRGEARATMSRLFGDAARRAGKDDAGIAMDEERALLPPITVAVVAALDMGHPQVPAHEQWACVGGALTNFLNAAQALGFGGKMLSGAKARDPGLVAAFCAPGETLLGWIALGTPVRSPKPRAAKANADAALQFWGE